MSEHLELDAFKTHLLTQGFDSRTLQMAAEPLASIDEVITQKAEGDRLHTLPELRVASSEASDSPPDLSLLDTLGEGGMGLVRLANQVSLDREVAVKTTRDGIGEAARRALLQEAYVTGCLEHPNIIPIYTVGRTDDGAPLIVMKRVEGTSWLELLATEEASPPEDLTTHLEILIQVCNAVRFAHSRGIIHRDIKPENVMIGHFDEVYLLDWGIAVALDDDRPLLPHRSQAQGICGTPQYMAPEMTTNTTDDLDELTDVYLLGATLHHILSRAPRHGGASNLQVLFAAHRSEPHEYADQVPAELADIANKACHADKAQRFQSAEALRDALQDYLQHRESIVLSTSAEAKLDELREIMAGDQPDALAIHDTYGECRFGFYQALRMWADNPEATAGLQACLEVMADYYLDEENLDAARACVAELPEPRPKLSERADALASRLEQDQEHLERLKKLERNMDMRTASKSRSILMVLLGVLWTATSLYASIRADRGLVTHAEELYGHMLSGFRNLLVTAVALFAFRKRVFANAVNRRLIYLLVSMVTAVAFLRWSVWYTQESVHLARSGDSVVYVLTIIAIGLLSDLRICLISVFFGSAAIVGVFWPELQLYGHTAATALTFGAFAWIWSPKQMRRREQMKKADRSQGSDGA